MLIAALWLASMAPAFAAPPKAGDVFRDCPDCPDMVVIPAGAFMMGAAHEDLAGVDKIGPIDMKSLVASELPRHKVTIARPFALGRTEVTRGQYAQFVRDTARPDPPGCAVHDNGKDSWRDIRPGASWRNPSYPQADDHPVVCTSADDAGAYAAWLSRKTGHSYRVPSEAEWEYAARGGTTTVHYWGDESDSICERAQIGTTATATALGPSKHWKRVLMCGSDQAFTLRVASFPPNPFGLYDMLGNAVEATADCWNPDFIGAPADGSAWRTGDCGLRVGKGGGFLSQPIYARPANRGGGFLTGHFSSGFRVARAL